MSLRIHSQCNLSMVLIRVNHLFIHNYIRSLLNIILRPILLVRTRLELVMLNLYVINIVNIPYTIVNVFYI